MNRALTLLGLLACLALVAAGCGSGGDDDGTSTTAGSPASAASEGGASGGDDPQQAADRGGGDDGAEGGSGGADDGGGDGSGGGAAGGAGGGKGASGLGGNDGRGSKAGRSGGGGKASGDPSAGFEIRPGADNSIQEYGTEATGGEKSAVVNAMFSFFRALAKSDYPGICSGLTSANVEQLEMFLKLKDKPGNCETVLAEILNTQAPEARKALNGTVYQVREQDGNAFVLFTPQGGSASYFVMKNENGAWKSTSVTAGTPLIPGA